jgi:hypothetical protein
MPLFQMSPTKNVSYQKCLLAWLQLAKSGTKKFLQTRKKIVEKEKNVQF